MNDKKNSMVMINQIGAEDLIDRIARRTAEIIFESKEKESESTNLLTRKEAASLLAISMATLHRWTQQGDLKSYSIGNRIYYKKNEVIESLTSL